MDSNSVVAAQDEGPSMASESKTPETRRRKSTVLSQDSARLLQAWRDCEALVDAEADGNVLSKWLLFSINHYNLLQERIILLCSKSLLRIKYDFKKGAVAHHVKTPLIKIKLATSGILQFPVGTASKVAGELSGGIQVAGREGLRLLYDQGDKKVSFMGRWNPWSKEMNDFRSTFCSLLPHANPKEEILSEDSPMSLRQFQKALAAQLPPASIEKVETMELEGGGTGLGAVVYNQSLLGAVVDRNGVVF